jgi:molybdopterin-guanine dinucleotide biosynthesis protein
LILHPRVITISGSHSGVGKTYLATLLIRSLPGFAAIKVTHDDLLVSVTDDEAEIMRPGKDTALMRQAGAREVIWIRAGERDLSDALSIAFDMVYKSGAPGVIIEGNAAAKLLKADLAFFVAGEDLEDMKPGALKNLESCDVVALNSLPGRPSRASGPATELETAIREHNRTALIYLVERFISPDEEIAGLFRRLV